MGGCQRGEACGDSHTKSPRWILSVFLAAHRHPAPLDYIRWFSRAQLLSSGFTPQARANCLQFIHCFLIRGLLKYFKDEQFNFKLLNCEYNLNKGGHAMRGEWVDAA